MTTSGSLLLLSFLLIIYNGGIKTNTKKMATKLNNRSTSKMYQMLSNTFETITITIATISLVIIATAISSGSLNGMNVAAAAATATFTTISLTDQQPKVAALISTPSVSSSSAFASATMLDYGITNVTAQVGTNAYLPCKVKIVFNKSVSWVRVRDDHILTVDQITFIADERFHAYHATENNGQSSITSQSSYQRRQMTGIPAQTSSSIQKQAANNDTTNAPWTLQIKYVQARDFGLYECQISAEPKISARVYLHVVVPKTEPIGDTVRYVKEGSRVALHCVISGAIDPPLYVIWYHGQQQIFPDNARQWKTEISHQDIQNKLPKTDDNESLPSVQQSMFESRKTVGSLIIPAIKKKDSGNYTCNPSNSPTVTIVLHVINGEYSASAITSSSSGCDHQRKIFNRFINILCIGVTLITSLIIT